MRRLLLVLPTVWLAARIVCAGGPVDARFDVGGKIKAVRARDLNGDGRADLVVLIERHDPDRPAQSEVLVLRAPAEPAAGSFVRDTDVVRISCSGEAAGARARAGAVAIGRFGPKGEARLRFVGPESTPDVLADGSPAADSKSAPSLVERSPGEALTICDGVSDLDGDGRDECFAPGADGTIELPGFSIPATESATRSDDELFVRASRSPSLTVADLDGDAVPELLRIDGAALLVERRKTATTPAVTDRVPLAFLAPDPARPPEQLRTPRLSIADVDGDRKADLLVTLIQGRADKIGGLRTSLYYFRGPFYAPAAKGPPGTHALVDPSSRLDTESVALHPRFVDLDGDGDLDYVADSIRGNMLDLIKRVTGAEPTIWYTTFRFDKAKGMFEGEPFTDVERPYSGPQARSNSFGRTGYLDGDFDGDGLRDLLDLTNLTKAVVLQGTRDRNSFKTPLGPTLAPPKGSTFAPDVVIADLDGDGVSDAVLWSDTTLFFRLSRGMK